MLHGRKLPPITVTRHLAKNVHAEAAFDNQPVIEKQRVGHEQGASGQLHEHGEPHSTAAQYNASESSSAVQPGTENSPTNDQSASASVPAKSPRSRLGTLLVLGNIDDD